VTASDGRRTSLLRLLAVALAFLATVAIGAAPAGARAEEPRYEVQLVSQSTVVTAGQPFTMTLDVDGAEPTDKVKVDVWGQSGPLATREQIRRAIESGDAADFEDLGLVRLKSPYSFTYGEVTDAATGQSTLTIPEDSTIDLPGVYLLSVRIDRGATRSPTLLTTTLVRSGQVGEGGRLDVALVLPVAAGLGHRPDGTVAFDDDDLGRLDGLAAALAGPLAAVPLTLEPRPETVDALADAAAAGDTVAAELLTALQTVASGRQVLPGSYVPTDDEALRLRDLDLLAGQLRSTGEQVLEDNRIVGTPTTHAVWRTGRTDTPDTLTMRADFGAEFLLVPDDALAPLDDERFPATLLQSFALETGAGFQMPAVATDGYLTDLAAQLDDEDRGDDQPLLAQRFVADLVAGYSDEPETVRGAVVVLPDDLDLRDPVVVDVLRSLGTIAELHLTTVDDLVGNVSAAASLGGGRRAADPDAQLVRELQPDEPTDLGAYPAALTAVERDLRGLASIAIDPAVTGSLDELRLVSASSTLDADGRRAYLDGVERAIDARLRAPDGGPALEGPGKQRVTMTSRRATIPIQIDNRLTFPMRVRIELESEKLDFPEGWLRETTLAPGPNTIEVEVEAKTSGDSLLEVTVLPPDGGNGIGPLTTGSFTVRSTALSGLGLAISIVALAVLVVWWLRHVIRTRRAGAAGSEPRDRREADASPAGADDDHAEPATGETPVATEEPATGNGSDEHPADTPAPSLTRTET
jgi:hypothetical protein